MSYEVKNPLMNTVTKKLLKAIDGVEEGTIDKDVGHFVVRACNGIRGAVETDLKTRLAQPKLKEIETQAAA